MPHASNTISNPQRLLLLALEDADVSSFLHSLTGTLPLSPEAPSENQTHLAGKTHEYPISTAYYSTTLPIWIDILPSSSTELKSWEDEFASEAAAPVREALGGVIVLLSTPTSSEGKAKIEESLKAVHNALQTADVGVMLAICPSGDFDSFDIIEDLTYDLNFELIALDAKATTADADDPYPPKLGIERVKEALEANDWSGVPDEDEEDHILDDNSDTLPDVELGTEGEEMDSLKAGLLNGDEDGVEGLEVVLERLKVVREESKDLPEAERRRIAAEAVREVMKHL